MSYAGVSSIRFLMAKFKRRSARAAFAPATAIGISTAYQLHAYLLLLLGNRRFRCRFVGFRIGDTPMIYAAQALDQRFFDGVDFLEGHFAIVELPVVKPIRHYLMDDGFDPARCGFG